MLFYPLLRKECLQLIRHLAPGKYALSKCADTPVVIFFFFFFFWLCCEACGILVAQSGIEPMPLAVEAQSSNHWTARDPCCLSFLAALLQNWAW